MCAAYLFHANGTLLKQLAFGNLGSQGNYYGHSVSIDKKIVVESIVDKVNVFSTPGDLETIITCDECNWFGNKVKTFGDKIIITSSHGIRLYSTSGELIKSSFQGDKDMAISETVIITSSDESTYVHSNSDDYNLIATIPANTAYSGGASAIATHADLIMIITSGILIEELVSISNFGYAVAITRDEVAISAMTDDHGGMSRAGVMYIYTWTGEFTRTLVAPDAASWDTFGSCPGSSVDSVANMVVRAIRNDSWGAVYIFPLPSLWKESYFFPK